MATNSNRKDQAQLLRVFRKWHRTTGALLFVFFFIVAITGLLLGWKKNSAGLIMANSAKGSSTELRNWLSNDSLYKKACTYLHDSVATDLSTELDRIDIRKDKGIVKFVFANHFTGLQLDGATGNLLLIEQRRSDFIEKIHDGSIIDHYFKSNGYFKLMYTTVMGIALLIFTVTGFWLWYGPKKLRNKQS